MNIGSIINDCYMKGIGSVQNIMNKGVIEAIGKDWVIVRDTERDEAIFVGRSIIDLEEFLKDDIYQNT